jgi:hypothetical protein
VPDSPSRCVRQPPLYSRRNFIDPGSRPLHARGVSAHYEIAASGGQISRHNAAALA